ncbi:MAG: NADH-quinone oxidoreductase subunit I [Thermoplasmatota archaeon]
MREYEKTGVLSVDHLRLPSEEHLARGVAVIECVQDIPCNPCVDACPVQAISMEDINAPPQMDYEACIGCGQCVAVCPGLAIFLVKVDDGRGWVTLPYEMLPVPGQGDQVTLVNREGEEVGRGTVTKVVKRRDTCVVTVEVPPALAMQVRAIRVKP